MRGGIGIARKTRRDIGNFRKNTLGYRDWGSLLWTLDILPSYLNDLFVINSQRHSRNTRYSNLNVICLKYNRETEEGRNFRIACSKLWNMLDREQPIKSLRRSLWKNIFTEQCSFCHFSSL